MEKIGKNYHGQQLLKADPKSQIKGGDQGGHHLGTRVGPAGQGWAAPPGHVAPWPPPLDAYKIPLMRKYARRRLFCQF